MTFQVINPESLGAPKGWNNGLLAPAGGRVLFVAGQDARDASGNVTATGIVDQFAQVLDNLLTVVREAGGKPEHIGRMTIYVTDLEAYVTNLKPIGEAYRKRMGRHYPAMALVEVKALMESNALIEVEATAVLPS
ncbi:MAG: RidA family protein [Gemmatimonadetes bacterium]|nr:RidA family protein [Gemmatimonadota bacterium]